MWGLAILIIPAFVIWGSGSSDNKGAKGPGYAGKIFDRKVSFEEYINMWQVARDYVTKNFGANFPSEFIDQVAWNRILLLEAAKRENVNVKDSELVEQIVSFPVFQREGAFDKKLYLSILGDKAKGFEEKLKDDMLIAKVREKVISGISVTNDEVMLEYKKEFEKIKASYINMPFTDFEKDINHTDAGLLDFYSGNKENFRKPEQINVKYIEILFSGFKNENPITEESVTRYFEEHMPDYKNPDSEENPELNDEIRKNITEKLAAEREKNLAEELAYKTLDESLNKKNLGQAAPLFSLATKETGFYSTQDEIPGIGWSYEFTKKAFELKQEEISNTLIKTNKGFYIIQLKGKKASYIPEFDEVKDTVLKLYIKNESEKLAEEKAKQLLTAIKGLAETGKTFEVSAKESGLEVKQTDFITRSGYVEGMGPAAEFVETAFSLENNQIGGPVKMQESWVIVKPDEIQGIDEAEFAEEKESFREKLLAKKQQETFDKWFSELKRKSDFVSYTAE
jgi:peptidyl-prolyl cis-trans isomerase D